MVEKSSSKSTVKQSSPPLLPLSSALTATHCARSFRKLSTAARRTAATSSFRRRASRSACVLKGEMEAYGDD